MKIAITGKGGVGKTTIASLLAHSWAKTGYKVLAIDSDPVSSLAGALGFHHPDRIIPLSEMSDLIEERTGAKPGAIGQMFRLNPKVEDLPDKIACQHDNIKLIVMGGVKTGGSGCACPESALIKALIRHLLLESNERVIIDMEAGVEHLGRSTADAVHYMIAVVEPGLRSIQTAQRIKTLAQQIGIKNIVAVANKIKSSEDYQFILKYLDKIEIIGNLSWSESIANIDKFAINHKEAVESDLRLKQEVKTIIEHLERKDV
ncbi:MAG: AAA family ATPase [Planctomycetota bacterium]|nr:AAA family ATPase [Planctomycetota bacterium]